MCIYLLYHTIAIALTQIEEHRHKSYSLFKQAYLLIEVHVEEYPIALYLL